MRRYCFINRIGDKHIIKVKDFVIFEDAYLTEYDTILVDENTGIEYNALYYTTIEESVLETPNSMPYVNGWRMRKRTAIKFDKVPPITAKLYIKRNYSTKFEKIENIIE